MLVTAIPAPTEIFEFVLEEQSQVELSFLAPHWDLTLCSARSF